MSASILSQFDSASGFYAAWVVFFALLIGHVLADYPLQGSFLSVAKNRHADLTRLFGGEAPPRGLWIHALTAHSLVHAGVVWLITGSLALGMVELVLHWAIDFSKCERWTNFTSDQLLHVACKVGYAAVIAFGLM